LEKGKIYMKFAIMGTGVMGCGWITQCAVSGHEVHCYDSNPDSVAAAAQQCEKLASKTARKFKIDDPDYGSKAIKKITPYKNKKDFIDAAQSCDVFFEVIFEDMDLKRAVLSEILPQLPKKLIFWSNTSSLDIDALADAGGRPDRSIVTHGMNPVPFMPGVEVVPGIYRQNATGYEKSTLSGTQHSRFLGKPALVPSNAGCYSTSGTGENTGWRR
jgi:3-hydroxybutyryl-CoA dehydrogenase